MALSTALQLGIAPPFALLPDSPWWTDEIPDQLKRADKATMAAFGTEQQFTNDGPILDCFRPYAHFGAHTGFAVLNGAGVHHDIPDLPEEVLGNPAADPDVLRWLLFIPNLASVFLDVGGHLVAATLLAAGAVV